MSKDDRKLGPGQTGRRKPQASVLSSSPELSAAQETELWGVLERRAAAVDALAQAKLTSLDVYLQSVDAAPLSKEEFAKLAGKALRRAIEQPSVGEVLGATLPARAHQVLCGCLAEVIETKKPTAASTLPDPAEWVRARLPLDHFEGALKEACSDEEKLWKAVQDGEQARNRLLERYISIAVHLAKARQGLGLSFPELRAAALNGLQKAIHGFRPGLGNQFSTYATPIIRNEIADAFRYAPGLKGFITRRSAAVEKERAKLQREFRRPVSDAEVYQSLGLSELEQENFTKAKLLLRPMSLDAGPVEGGAALPENREGDQLVQLVEREKSKRIYDAVDQLGEPARTVVWLRFFDIELFSSTARLSFLT